MSKTIISVLVVGVVVVGGYFALNHKKVEAPKMEKEEVAQRPSDRNDKKIPFSEFVKQGGSYKCEVKQVVSNMENIGTVYINGKNIRGEYTSVVAGKTIDTSFMMKDGYSYSWSSIMPNAGYKIKIPDTNTSSPGITNMQDSGAYSWNANQIGEYNCEPWTVDESIFNTPSNIKYWEVQTK
jgi:hypothetical protein